MTEIAFPQIPPRMLSSYNLSEKIVTFGFRFNKEAYLGHHAVTGA